MSNGEMRLALIVEAFDRLSAPFKRMEAAVAGPVRAARAQLKELDATFSRISSSASGIVAAVGGGLAVREITQFRDQFERLRVDVGDTPEAFEELRAAIIDTAQRARVPVGELALAFENAFHGGLPIEEATKDLRELAAGIQLLNGQGTALGAFAADLQQFSGVSGPEQLAKTLAMVREQTIGVTDGFKEFMTAAPQLLSVYQKIRGTRPDNVREIGGLFSVIAQGTRSPGQAIGAIQELISKLQESPGANPLEAIGVHVFGRTSDERKANIAAGHTMPITEIVRELVKKYATANPLLLDQAIGSQLSLALRIPIAEAKQNRGVSPSLEQALAMPGDTTRFFKDASADAGTFAGSLNALSASLRKIGDSVVAGPLKTFADLLGDMPNVAASAIAALGGLAVLGTVGKWAAEGLSMLKPFFGVIRLGIAAVSDLSLAIRAGYGVMAAFNVILAANPIGLVVAGIAALAGAAYLIYKNWQPIKEFFKSLWDGVAAAFDSAWARIKPIVEPILKAAGFLNDMDKGKGPIVVGPSDRPTVPASALRAPIRSAFTPAAGDGQSGKKTEVGGEFVFRFENTPPGLRYQAGRSTNAGVGVDVDMGFSLVGP